MSDQLERIIAEGTQVPIYPIETMDMRSGTKPSNQIVCADGFTLSVIAGWGAYCIPRPGYDDHTVGPFIAVEVGFPSRRPEPWPDWVEHCESPDSPTETVYGDVPVGLVRALVESHGGAR